MPKVVMYFRTDGTVRGLYNESLEPLLEAHNANVERVSHVEPRGFLLRQLFRLLRRWFGEDGRIGRWLRTWKCRWRVDFGVIGGGVFDRDDEGNLFKDRQAAIDFEIPRANLYLKEGTIPYVSAEQKSR